MNFIFASAFILVAINIGLLIWQSIDIHKLNKELKKYKDLEDNKETEGEAA